MTSDRVVALLKQHNAWRRGEEIPQLDPKDVGEAIDAAIHLLSSRKSAKNRRGDEENKTGGRSE